MEEESEAEIATTPEDEGAEAVTEIESLQDIFAGETKEEQTEPGTEAEGNIITENGPEIKKREKAVREVFGDEESTEPPVTAETEAEKSILEVENEARAEAEPLREQPTEESPAPPEEKSTEEKPSGHAKEPIVTSTLGEIYAAQGHFAKAVGVYEVLLKKNPGNEFYKEKIESLKRKQEEAERPDFEE